MTIIEPGTEPISTALRELWRSGRQTSLERIDAIEAVVASMLLGEPCDPAPAIVAAHKLAGTLGMFGLPGGSAVARKIELELEGGDSSVPASTELAELVTELRQSVESAPEVSADDAPRPTMGRLHVVGPDRSYLEALRVGAGQAGFDVDGSKAGDTVPTSGLAVLVVDGGAVSNLEVHDLLRRVGPRPLVVSVRTPADLVVSMALTSAGVDMLLGTNLEPADVVDMIVSEIARGRRATRTTILTTRPAETHRLGSELPGWHVRTSRPEEILDQTQLPVDVIVVDMVGVGVDPLELCRLVRAAPATRSARIVALYPKRPGTISGISDVLWAGADDVVWPSLGWAHIAQRLRRLVSRTEHTGQLPTTSPGGSEAGGPQRDPLVARIDQQRAREEPVAVLFVAPRDAGSRNEPTEPGAGAARLSRMERVLQAAFGSGDVVGRWKTGFVAVLTATRLTARERLEHLCAELEHAGMPVDGAVAVLGEDAGNADELLDVALVRSRANAGRAQTQAHQRRILVVEDDTLVASVVNDLLSSRGYAVTTISDGASAAEVLCSADVVQRFQLVVLDVSLPGLDGFGLLRRMQRAGTAGELPVVLLTARATEDEIVTGLELGAVDHVAKPFSPLVLMSRLERALGS